MKLRDTTVVALCAFLGVMALLTPIPVFSGPYEGLAADEVDWTCRMPLLSLAPPDVDLDDVRARVETAHVTADSTGAAYVPPKSPHPLCGGLARTQVVLALLAFAGAAWRGTVWWRSSTDARAEKRFKRLHAGASGNQGRKRLLR
ncbi:hypothetical protein [Candidatus Poriferisodalis sp.]|uniref:hypothetical protein n=1 Tax=Candidatus Poriferisodalis sp. TaxID=3101277 RepID=UPI003B015806